mgnify:CR=1 FL=1
MSKRFLTVVFAFAALGIVATVQSADRDKTEDDTFEATCIVSGAPAKAESHVAYRGKKLYFCCNNCPKAYKKNPEKFEAKANHQLLDTKQITQVACPITGKPVNEEKKLDINGVTVGFCCDGCKGRAEKAGDDAVDFVFANFDKGFTLQTECPVSGKPIKADQMVEYKGQKVYFCCPGCPGAFEKEPEKFSGKVPQLAEQKKKEKKS